MTGVQTCALPIYSDFLVGIHPGASKPPRSWSSERFGRLCEKLYRELNAKIILFGGADDKGRVSEIEANTKDRKSVV